MIIIGEWEVKKSSQYGNRTHVKAGGKQIFVIEHYTENDAERDEIENLIAESKNMYEFIKEMAETYSNSEWIAGRANEIINHINQHP